VTRPVRLGAVDYLNVRPLVHGLDRRTEDVSLRFDLPSVCAKLLAQSEIDLGMVPSITLFDRPGDRIVPGLCIGSDGPVASVALFTRKPMRDVRSIALDTSSRTSAALTRILCARRFDIAPAFVQHDPDLSAMLATADAALLIGDPALFATVVPGVQKIDLGAEWTAMTGLPFVWAFWAGRADAADAKVVAILTEAAEAGMAQTDQVAAEYCAARPERIALAQQYLRDHLMFRLTPRALDGLGTYYREAVALGMVRDAGMLEFFDKPALTAEAR
jgi:chorismate dehydratase